MDEFLVIRVFISNLIQKWYEVELVHPVISKSVHL